MKVNYANCDYPSLYSATISRNDPSVFLRNFIHDSFSTYLIHRMIGIRSKNLDLQKIIPLMIQNLPSEK